MGRSFDLLSERKKFIAAIGVALVLIASSTIEGCNHGDAGPCYSTGISTSGASFPVFDNGASVIFQCPVTGKFTNISSPTIAWQRAVSAAETLQYVWFNSSCKPFCWTNGSFWTDANALEALLNLKAEADLNNSGALTKQLANVTKDIFQTQDTTPLLVAPPFYDDALWWGLTWLRAYEEFGDINYLDRSLGILDTVYSLAWDTSFCGGGLWWNIDRQYKNAITNELFAALSSKLALTTGNKTIEGYAMQSFNWFQQSGMLNPSSNLINDGLNSTCQNNNQTTWTYNQGVILSAATNMYKITNDTSYLNYTTIAALTNLVYPDDGVLMDPCDLDPGGCDADGSQFKGVFVRHLLYATQVLETVLRSPASWRKDIGHMADIMWANSRLQNGTTDELGGNWKGPFDFATPIRQAAALDLLVFAADKFTM
ncbi:unnamed protein product [Calypogeia fissa]